MEITPASSGRSASMIGIVALILAVVGVGAGIAGFSAARKTDTAIGELKKQIGQAVSESQQTKSDFQSLSSQVSEAINTLGRNIQVVNQKADQSLTRIAALQAPSRPVAATNVVAGGAAGGVTKPADGGAGAAKPSGKVHVVESGDNYGKIARKYNTTTAALIKANPDVDPGKLKIGQKINLP